MSSRYQRRMTADQRWEDENMGIDSASYWTRRGAPAPQAPRTSAKKTNLEKQLATQISAVYPLKQAGWDTTNEDARIADLEAQISTL